MDVNNSECEKNVAPEYANTPLLVNEQVSVARGGMTSEVARRLADTCVKTKEWDEQNYNIAQRTKEKWQGLDEKYKIEEKVVTATHTTIDAMKSLDEKHQITRKLTDKAKDLDEKYEISAKVGKVKNDENVKNVCGKVTQVFNFGWGLVVDIATETKERVNEAERNKERTTEGVVSPNNEKVVMSEPSQSEGNATPAFSTTNVE